MQLPCTTPASQQGILHGTCAGVPAFRWYDRELGRVVVANRPADAALIEERASTGRGLLADDGVSISNLFSGDAPTSMLTMSRGQPRPRFQGDPPGRRQVRGAAGRLRPQHSRKTTSRWCASVSRRGSRTAPQRRTAGAPVVDLRVPAGGEQRGAARPQHGAGRPADVARRPEHLRRLRRLRRGGPPRGWQPDRGAARSSSRWTRCSGCWRHRQGGAPPLPLRHPLRPRAVPGPAVRGALRPVARRPVQRRSPARTSCRWRRTSRAGAGSSRSSTTWRATMSIGEQTAARAASRMQSRSAPGRGRAPTAGDLVVLGSGNLGLVYAREPRRLMKEEIDAALAAAAARAWPRRPGIGFVAVMSQEHGPLVIGADGHRPARRHRRRGGPARRVRAACRLGRAAGARDADGAGHLREQRRERLVARGLRLRGPRGCARRARRMAGPRTAHRPEPPCRATRRSEEPRSCTASWCPLSRGSVIAGSS